MVGPMAGATDITIEMLPMVLPRDSGGTRFITVVISSGIMIAVPTACTTRPSTSSPSPGATAQSSVPRVKVDIAIRKIGRVLRRCSRKPVIGITTAMVNRNAVVSHWAAPAVTLRSSIRLGMATLMMVSLRNTTKVDTSSRAITSRLRLATSGSRAGSSGTESIVASILMVSSILFHVCRCDERPGAISTALWAAGMTSPGSSVL